MDTINIILNGKIISGKSGQSILNVAMENGIEIPTLCHDPRLEPYSSCYVCVVEIEGLIGLQPSCSTKIIEGMKINTQNEKVRKARKAAVDLIVSNHYADCAAPCKQKCPAGVDVQGYISLIEKGLYSEAIALIKKVNPLPAICGRVCVRPCEVACRRNLLDETYGVGIDYLKRFAADQDLSSPFAYKPSIKASTGKKVAIIGAGPGGLSAAWFLQQEGHQCDIFEASPQPGGWLRYGIPEYRLPNDVIDKEVKAITDLGAQIFYNTKFGGNLSYKEIKEKYDATVLTIGSQLGTSIGCEGDDAGNVFSGIDFLRNMEMTGQRYDFRGKTVAVIGGGNTAMDCCRTSLRCHADKVYVIYRRTEKEMPANPIEIHESKLEGVEYMFLTAPKKVNKDEKGDLTSITCLKMDLGEPDASGRRRPVMVEGSDFDVKVDYILAAIGQKTQVDFINNINEFANDGELKVNKWGDLDADPKTLQTGIKSVFAAGDGVTGPATVIEAINQARIAALSCHQYLSGQELVPEPKEFLSKRDNFKKQVKEDYIGYYEGQPRHEMPTIDPNKRMNFDEVELGYENEKVAKNETTRCLECGCVEYFDCELKRIATEYNAEQNKYAGEFKQYDVKFDHPFIEIDNNKCILCARCVRICSEVVGANALGLINRGFDTYVAPSLGMSLKETDCESCGMCISACPTAAISENYKFKPGPVKTEKLKSICNYCSVGCEVNYHVNGKHIWQVSGSNGSVNPDANICRYPKFGYVEMNKSTRITKPMHKVNGEFKEISFNEAYNIIASKIKEGKAGFFAGARSSNEEIFMVKKLAELSPNSFSGSFHYIGRGKGYGKNTAYNTPFSQIKEASHIWLLGSEINKENAVVSFMLSNNKFLNQTQISLISNAEKTAMDKKCDEKLIVKSYYHFVKAVNHYLLSNNLQNSLFIEGRSTGFDEYKKTLLAQSFAELCNEAGTTANSIKAFAEAYNNEMNAILVYAEKNVCAATAKEIRNMAVITGKLGKTASGILGLKEKNNSEGISNSGILCNTTSNNSVEEWTEKFNSANNLFIFGEDPIGCSNDKSLSDKWLNNKDFVMVQDYYMTETAAKANLILPATFPHETGGTFTNTLRIIQWFDKVCDSQIENSSIDQLINLGKLCGFNSISDIQDVHSNVLKDISQHQSDEKIELYITTSASTSTLFKAGCDALVLNTDNYFINEFKNN